MRKTTLFAALLFALPAFSQPGMKDVFAKHWTTSKDFTLAVAQAMPADLYSFRPNQEEMSFGQLMAHIATANNMLFSRGTGVDAPKPPAKVAAAQKDPAALDKETAIKFLTESFDFCSGALAKASREQLEAVSGPEGRQALGFERLWSAFTHTAHHRGQAEVYLRVKNIKPPDYKF